jgi:DNA helicase-2/ATP-dependent DNA helicase PcrA
VGDPLDGLNGAQHDAATRAGVTLLIPGVPGAGKTEVLARRVCWLADAHGLEPHRPLVLARDAPGRRRLTDRIEDLLDRPHEALTVRTVPELCGILVDEHAQAAGIEELTAVLTAAERLALLLERVESLELRYHDYRGRPLALLAAMVRRIDKLKSELIDVEAYAAGAGGRSERDREFAAVYQAHEELLREHGAIDSGGQLLACVRMLEREPLLASELAQAHPHLLVDDWESRPAGARRLIVQLALGGASLTATGNGEVLELREQFPEASVVRLDESIRCPQPILDAAAAVDEHEPADASTSGRPKAPATVISFWRCTGARAQARRAAVELERLTRAEGVDPARCAVLVRSIAVDGPAVAEALSERAIRHSMLGTGAFFEHSEVRDVLAWLRLLVDPRDAAAVVRALSRPPIELHAADVARCVQLSRRRKLDLVTALELALASPALSPEARERIATFRELQRAAAAGLDEQRSDLFVHGLIEQLGLRRRQLFSARADVVDRLRNLGRLEELAARHQRALPGTTPREFAVYAAAVAESGIGEPVVADASALPGVTVAAAHDVAGREFDHVLVLWRAGAHDDGLALAMTRAREQLVLSVAGAEPPNDAGEPPAALERARRAAGGEWEVIEEELLGPAGALLALFGERRDELLDSVARVGARLGELRFDTDIDVTHAVVRLLELIKLAALLERRAEQPIGDALADINARLAAAATPLEREILLSSPLDELLSGRELDRRARPGASEEPSLAPFLPRRGDGLVLSATDVDAYRACPLRYKFARVLRVPREPTLNQRFGIVVHQVLERYHQQGHGEEGQGTMLRLLDAAWRRGGFGDSAEERQLREKARHALLRYQERLTEAAGGGSPRWFERSFSFNLGPHVLRGRVDRIDELPDGGHELIDYKTGVPKRPDQLREDVQLALYALAAQEAWQLEATERTFYYVLDDVRVSLGRDANGSAWVTEAVAGVGAGILAQAFEPTPSRPVCALCDYRIACPAAEY